MVAVGGPHPKALLLATKKALLAHQTTNAIAPMSLAALTELKLNPGSSISLATLQMNACDLLLKLLVLVHTRGRLVLPLAPVIIAACRDFKELAQNGQWVLSLH
jgi:hypothetical protein